MDRRLPKIAELMELQVNASRTRLRQVQKKEAFLVGLLRELDNHLRGPADSAQNRSIVEFRNEIQMHRWIEQRRAAVNTELAQAKVMVSLARSELAKHFARHQATERLVDQATLECQKKSGRRGRNWDDPYEGS